MNSDASESARLLEFLAWVEVNKKRLVIGAIAAVVIGLGVYVYRHQAAQKELAASEALLALRAPMGAATNAPAPAPADFLKVASQYSGTDASKRALVLAAGTLFTEGKYAEAKAQFEKILTADDSGPFAPAAALPKAAATEAMGQQNEAIAAYQNVIAKYPNDGVATEAKLMLARIYESKNQFDQAAKLYQEVAEQKPASVWSDDARTRRQQVLAKMAASGTAAAPGAAAPSAAGTAPSTAQTNPAPKTP
jgi:tetratricopeptide (TPR) repeat protein